METRHKEYEYNIGVGDRSKTSSDNGGGIAGLFRILKTALGTTVAGAVAGGPLLVGMGITLALTLSLGVIGIPLMLIFSPLLIIPCFILGTAIAGFSVAALLALAAISTLNSVFPSYSSFNISVQKTAADDTKGLKEEQPRQETIIEEQEQQESRVPPSSIVSEPAAAADKDAGQGEEDVEEESNVNITKDKDEEEEEEEEGENETTVAAPSSQTPLVQPDAATPTTATDTDTAAGADTSQKKQPSQKSKKQKPKK